MRRALRIYVVGIVQGVGFRPYIEYLARRHGLAGYVRNMGGGEVEIYIEGDEGSIDGFMKEFREDRPSAIVIEELSIHYEEPRGLSGFRIVSSSSESREPSIIPPDLAICDDCLREFRDPGNRRYLYFFISCSWCGPRFAIIKELPYDRPNTSWSQYPMCRSCEEEYSLLRLGGLRRYFYQGISCPQCGPRIVLRQSDGSTVDSKDPVALAAKLIDEGYIVAIKGVGGFHIAALASDDDVVIRLRARKHRPQQPFAVMALEESVGRLVYVDDEALRLLKSPQRPILLLPKREDSPVSKYVSPGLSEEGVFLPYTAIHYYLLEHVRDGFLIMTSGNVHGKPMCRDLKCVLRELRGVVDYVLDHGLEIQHRVDDSVLRRTNGRWVFLRRGRGYAPMWLRSPVRFTRPVIAFGAELSNAGAVAFGERVVPTQYIGDTDDFDTLMELDGELRWLANVYRVKDPVLVCDLNPTYSSTWLCNRWSEELGAEALRVQHHHAHALAVALEYGETGPFTAVTIDGVGYGVDGTAWGGEVLEVYGDEFKRRGGLMPVPMPGGDAAALRPIRMVASLLYTARGASEAEELLGRLGVRDANLLIRLVSATDLRTSSLGRFLDAVAAALGVATERTYEGEPAMKLEATARGGRVLPIHPRVKGNIIDTPEFFAELVEAYLSGASIKDVAYTAQYAVGRALGEVACSHGERVVYVSGGAAVNDYVVKGIEEVCGEVRLPRLMPPGDGGIAVGQAHYAAFKFLK